MAFVLLSSSCTPNSRGAYKYVAILGVDGGGAWFTDDVTPASFAIGRDGATAYDAQTCFPSISAECWGTMLMGVLPDVHKLTNAVLYSQPTDPNRIYPSLFKLIRAHNPEAKLASFCGWNPINTGIIEDNIGVVKGSCEASEIEDKNVRYPYIDKSVADQAVKFVEENDPSFLFVQFNYTDAGGHWYGYGSSGHLETIKYVDGLIKDIYDAYEKKGILDDTLFIITADHGGTPDKTHGGDTPEEMTVFLGIHGKTIQPGSHIINAEVQDIPYIAAYALGLEIPESWTGKIPDGLFKDVK